MNDTVKQQPKKTDLDFKIAQLESNHTRGFLGRFFGSPDGAPFNIAGITIILIVLTLCGSFLFTDFRNGETYLKYMMPVVTGCLGYIFGKSKSEN